MAHPVALAILDVLHAHCAAAFKQHPAHKRPGLGGEVGAAECWVQVRTGCAPALACRTERGFQAQPLAPAGVGGGKGLEKGEIWP